MITPGNTFTIAELAAELDGVYLSIEGGDIELPYASSNSENVKDGLFVAIAGSRFDGHDFIDKAFQNGARAVLLSNPERLGTKPGIIVPDTRKAYSALSALYYGNPSKECKVIGVTGTNGKTTTTSIIYEFLKNFSYLPLRIGTLGAEAQGIISRGRGLTTPDPMELQALIREAVNGGANACVMEVSSHALDQARVNDIQFDVAVFTNLTHEHLDYHGNMERYFDAKRSFFHLLAEKSGSSGVAVVNADCRYGKKIVNEIRSLKLCDYSFGRTEGCSWQIVNFEQDMNGSAIALNFNNREFTLKTNLIGRYNAENLVAAVAACHGIGCNLDKLIAAAENVPQVPGRLQAIEGAPGVFIDYCHTPDGFQVVLSTLRELTAGELWIIFGCGGDRDSSKRAPMGNIAGQLADRVVLTLDNPRSEDPEQIIKDITSDGLKPEFVDLDRGRAIKKVLEAKCDDDIVLIAGKGNEDYQDIKGVKYPYSDLEEVKKFYGL